MRQHPTRARTALVLAMVCAGLLTVALGTVTVAPATALRQESFDEAGVRAAVSKRIEGRTAFNARLSAEPFEEDAVWINAFGRRLVGRANIEEFLTQLYANQGFVGAEVTEPAAIAEVVFLRPDVAVARVFTRTRGQRLRDGTMIAERRSHNTMTLTREASGWKVRYEIVTDERDPARLPQ